MKIACAKCGEELLGAVNRCWKCGTTFDAPAGDETGPPVRRAPIENLIPIPDPSGDVPVMAELAEPDPSSPLPAASPRPARLDRESAAPAPGGAQVETPETRAPVAGVKAAGEGATPARPPTTTTRPGFRFSHRYGGWLGALALTIGLASAAFSFHSFWALAGSVAGLVFGIWALAGKRRGAAMLGIIVCCIALTVSGYRALLVAYTAVMGYSPFDQRRPVDDVFPEPLDPSGGSDGLGEDW